MRGPRDRTYDIRLQRKLLDTERNCDRFHSFVQVTAQRNREVLRFSASQSDEGCGITLEVRCPSYGKPAIHRFQRTVQLKYPNVIFVQFTRR